MPIPTDGGLLPHFYNVKATVTAFLFQANNQMASGRCPSFLSVPAANDVGSQQPPCHLDASRGALGGGDWASSSSRLPYLSSLHDTFRPTSFVKRRLADRTYILIAVFVECLCCKRQILCYDPIPLRLSFSLVFALTTRHAITAHLHTPSVP